MATKEEKIAAIPAGEKLVLKPEILKLFLQNFDYNQDRATMQYQDLIMSGRCIEALNNSLLEVKSVRNIDLSNNNIVDISILQNMENLVKLNISKNKIKNIAIFTNENNFLNLKWLDCSSNKYTDLAAFKLPKLEYLDISYNRLEKINEGWVGHPTVKVLKSVDNRFKNLAPFKDMPALEELYLQANSVNSITGYESLPNLKKLHLRKNKIEKIEEEIIELPALTYLNLRQNKLNAVDQVSRLFQFSALNDLNVLGNPLERHFSSLNLLTSEILIINPKLARFNKITIGDQQKLEAVYLARFRWEKSEEERIRKEEEERRKQEAEEAAANAE